MPRIVRTAIAIAALIAATLAANVSQAQAHPQVLARPQALAATDPVSTIYSASQNSCLDVSKTDPAHYFLDTYGAPCNGSAAQSYSFHLLAVSPANTYQIISRSTGQCLTKYRYAIRQSSCSTASSWTLQPVGTGAHQYRFVLPSTVGAASPGCVQVNPKLSGYPGPIFATTYCSSSLDQVLTLAAPF